MRVVCINLDRSHDRWEYFQHENRHLTDVERFSAVDGTGIDKYELARKGIIAGDDILYTDGALGCALSHRTLWERAVNKNESLTVTEDDALLSYFFQERSRNLVQAIDPDWDFILWGWGLNNYIWLDLLPNGIVSEIRFIESLGMMNLTDFQMSRRPTVLMRLIHGVGLVCYSVSPRGARILLDRCFPIRNELISLRHSGIKFDNTGIDCVATDIYADMKAYACVSPLATVEYKIPSTIR